MLLEILFPNRCLKCNTIISAEELVCTICMSDISFTHWTFSGENSMKQNCNLLFPNENAYALMHFEKEGLSRQIIHELKYRKREKVGQILAQWLVERIDLKHQGIDIIATVPLHIKKQKQRGYNQLHLFAECISKHYKIPFDHHLIKRNFYKQAQALNRKEQRKTAENLFSVIKTIENQHILVVDDVFTTGNTMSAIVWEILNSGKGNRISVLVMAVD